MGHIGPRTIDLIQWKGFVNRLDLMAPNDYDHVCTGCAHGKSHQKPMPGTSNTKYGKMELVVMDLTGPISVPTWDGYVYALVVVEVSCQYPGGPDSSMVEHLVQFQKGLLSENILRGMK